MSKDIKVKKGLSIQLKGSAAQSVVTAKRSDVYAVKPTDFHGITPKLTVKVGDQVKVGEVVFYSKEDERIKFTAPVSGTIKEIQRGAKRKVLAVLIEATQEDTYLDFGITHPKDLEREAVLSKVLESGAFPYIKQRPYDVIANPSDQPKAIYVSTFDTAPLAADMAFVLEDKQEAFQMGINVLAKLTAGEVNVGVQAGLDTFFNKTENVSFIKVAGQHPAGNVGTQIAYTNPVNQGERVWTVSPQGVAVIGELFLTGKYNPTKLVALAGSKVSEPKYIRLTAGQNLSEILAENVDTTTARIISGNVLTGTKISSEDYLGYYDNLISAIPEANQNRFMGWLPFVGSGKIHSFSKTSFSWLFPNKAFDLNTSTNGEDRALVVTGEFEKVVALDVYPLQLIKACMANDIEKMENLGIYEVAPEDFALVDYIDPSKTEAQEVIRKGLDLMIKEVG